MAASSDEAVGVTMDSEQLELSIGVVENASFTSAKIAMIKTLVQNFVFSTEQVAALLETVSMSSDKIDALKEFAAHVLDPENADPVLEKFSFDSDKEEAAGVLGEFSPAKAGTLVPPTFEQDVGQRSDDDMDALIAKLDDISMSDDKVAAILEDVAAKPSPPFDTEQLIRLLGCFSFSSDAVAVLEALLGPKAVYSMTCADIVSVLGTFGMSSDQLQVLPPLKGFIADPQNKLAIVASFLFSSDQETAEEILRDVVVRFKPPQPSPEVMAALARVGSCPSGYTWRAVDGGYRCAAGGHFVSAERLAEAMS